LITSLSLSEVCLTQNDIPLEPPSTTRRVIPLPPAPAAVVPELVPKGAASACEDEAEVEVEVEEDDCFPALFLVAALALAPALAPAPEALKGPGARAAGEPTVELVADTWDASDSLERAARVESAGGEAAAASKTTPLSLPPLPFDTLLLVGSLVPFPRAAAAVEGAGIETVLLMLLLLLLLLVAVAEDLLFLENGEETDRNTTSLDIASTAAPDELLVPVPATAVELVVVSPPLLAAVRLREAVAVDVAVDVDVAAGGGTTAAIGSAGLIPELELLLLLLLLLLTTFTPAFPFVAWHKDTQKTSQINIQHQRQKLITDNTKTHDVCRRRLRSIQNSFRTFRACSLVSISRTVS
jgi:hypothetical protein